MTTVLADDERDLLHLKGFNDPVWWIENVLGVILWDKQKEIVQSIAENKRTTVRSDSGAGKSFIAACAALWFLFNHYPSTVITTAPTYRQVEAILWREISTRHAGSLIPLGGSLSTCKLQLESQWFAIGMSTDEPERFQGFHNVHVLVVGDEASGLSEDVYVAIENPLAAGNSKELLIGNPTQSVGTFRDTFTSPIYNTIHISAFDTPNFTGFGITIEDIRLDTWKTKVNGDLPYPSLVTPSWVSERYQEWGEGSYLWEVYVLGNFPDAGVSNLIPLSHIEQCCNLQIEPSGVRVAALDVSRYGDDETVLMIGTPNKVEEIEAWSHQDTVYTSGRTARKLRANRIDVIRVDSIGVGGGVADMLKAEGFNVEEVNVGMPAIDKEKFLNIRAERYWLLGKSLEDSGTSIPDHSKLKGQLADIRYKYNAKGQLIIESKEDAKKRGSKSPDYADALMMLSIPVKANEAEVWQY